MNVNKSTKDQPGLTGSSIARLEQGNASYIVQQRPTLEDDDELTTHDSGIRSMDSPITMHQ